MSSEQEALLTSDEVAGISRNNQVISIGYLSSEDIGKLTDIEEDEIMGGARVELVHTKNVRIEEDHNVVHTDATGNEDPVYTVEDAIDYMGFGPFQILVTIFAGMVWISDAMEVMMLSVLSPVVTCDWELSNPEEAAITSVVFVGFLIGGVFWGVISDIIGRKKVLLIVTVLILLFGLGSAAAPEYFTLLLFRCLAGFGIGGTAQAVTYYVEFLPKKFRGVCIVLLEMWWGVGSVLAALLALAVIPNVPDPIPAFSDYYSNINWRIYVALCAVPMALVLVFFLFVPESARYYLSRGNFTKAEEVIRTIARVNFKSSPPGRLVSQEEKERLKLEEEIEENTSPNSTVDQSTESSFTDVNEEEQSAPLLNGESLRYSPDKIAEEEEEEDVANLSRGTCLKRSVKKGGMNVLSNMTILFTGGMWKTSILLFVIWFGCAWLYYGAILLTTTILEAAYDPHCGGVNRSSDTGCQNLTTDFYLRIVWTSAAEFPGIFITLVIIELIGRKITISAEFIGSALFFGLILICVPEPWITVFLFGARAFVTGVFQAVYVYTPEVYPTKVRGVAMGLMTAAARVGALVTPFVAQALFPINDYVTIGLYGGSAIILAVLTLLLPIETKGRSLKDMKG